MSLSELAERCEKEAEGCYDLDAHIGIALSIERDGREIPGLYGCAFPKYSTSLDAAMTLVPEGRINLNIAEDQITTAIVCGTQGCADTPALALCAAALRARGQ